MLTPADIDGKQFKPTRLREGYDQGEVDNFLDQVGDALRVTMTRLAAAEEKNRALERAGDSRATTVIPVITDAAPPTLSASAERILTLAQETADKHVSEAKSKASGIVGGASGTAARITEEARVEAERLKGEAVLEAQKIRAEGLAAKQAALDDLEARHGQVSAALDRLTTEGRKVREALSQALSKYDTEVPQ